MNELDLNILYDGKLIIGIFIMIHLLILSIKDKKKLLKINIGLNISFIILFLGVSLLERFLEYPMAYFADDISFVRYFEELLIFNSNRFIGVAVYFLINQIVLFKILYAIERNGSD